MNVLCRTYEVCHWTRTWLEEVYRASAPQEMAGDHQALDLAGALVDLRDFGVSEKFFHRVVAHEAVAAEHLDRGVGAEHGSLRREELGHARLFRERFARVLHPRGAVYQQAGCLDARAHIGHAPLQALKVGDGMS